MGNIDEAVPFFGQGFNKIYPLIMVVYTLLVASNFFGQVFSFLGKWKRFKLQNEEEDSDGFNPSGIMILQKGSDCFVFILNNLFQSSLTFFLFISSYIHNLGFGMFI